MIYKFIKEMSNSTKNQINIKPTYIYVFFYVIFKNMWSSWF